MEPISTTISVILGVKRHLDTAAIKSALAQTQQRLQEVEDRLDQAVVDSLTVGFLHLVDAVDLPVGSRFRRDALANARGEFTRLTLLGAPRLSGNSRQGLSSEQIYSLSRLGSYFYFLAVEEDEGTRFALQEAYDCTARFPALAVELFPVGIYSRDYKEELKPFVVARPKDDPVYRRRRRAYHTAYARIGGRRTVAAAAALVAGAAGGTLAALSGGSAGAIPVTWARRTWLAVNGADVLVPPPPTETRVEQEDPRLKALLRDLADEGAARYREVAGRDLPDIKGRRGLEPTAGA